MLELSPERMDRIKAIDWFARCGEPAELPIGRDIQYTSSWEEAKRLYQRRVWENTLTDALGDITGFLAVRHKAAYNENWNTPALEANAFMSRHVEPPVVAFAERAGWDGQLLSLVRLGVYEAGRLPCGWVEGRWPKGKLVVL